jgi:hypothetical protein
MKVYKLRRMPNGRQVKAKGHLDFVLGWSPFKIVSDSLTIYSRWLLLLKIEISLIVYS